MNSRQHKIVQLVSERGHVSVSELALMTGVSEVTVRQDLNLLERDNFLRRVHGSAVAPDSDDVSARMHSRYSVKAALAEFAATLVGDGESVFIEGGSTNALLARQLASRRDITIITVSHYIAHLLRESVCEVMILGGLYQKSSESVVGPLTRFCLQQLNFHHAFIGVDGWSQETGFTGRDMLRCDVVNALMTKDTNTVALTDSSKFGQIHPYPLAPDLPFRHVVTDSALSEVYKEKLGAGPGQLHLVSVT
ncbi:DNA-binding transcriptional regulator YciT [Pantoea ananatis]|uniref:DeoR/GlpR family DNA-binding transcription regulator n=1 Tax=Pantoea ananas TaxID=553 RepID=UPI0023B10844|nr:DNA-binding transcriptional regulator YciT [Pantoea ananatis]